MADPAFATARNVDDLTDVPLDGLPATAVDRIESAVLDDLRIANEATFELLRRCVAAEAEVERLREQNGGLYLAIQMGAKDAEGLRAENARLQDRLAGRPDSNNFRVDL